MHIGVVTLFPEMFQAISEYGISGRAVSTALVDLDFWNPRDFTTDKHRTVDDRPFGGGPGMLMKTEPLLAAIRQARSDLAGQEGDRVHTVYLSPQGKRLDHAKVIELSQLPSLILVCGRYQGIDSRVVETEIDEEISLGDFVLSGGELAAMAVVDALVRFQPGALGDEDSAQTDSFANGLLHSPQYTRPQEIEGLSIPPVLVSGDHQAIEKWRMKQSLGNTWLKRPDLLEQVKLTSEQEDLLNQFKDEYQSETKD
ncbi:MAG: tRNA (guanosine(37)-N1)-methyltransferase TrmD [Pseudomonadales bacterium]|nr:tRNA (guanosine(37)-N1)-methyltransferase TrmD [Pseudomonadales bacterium]